MAMRILKWIVVATIAALAATACSKPHVMRIVPGIDSGKFSELKPTALAAITVCADSLGRTDPELELDRCTPCVPFAVATDGERAVKHARDLWDRFAHAPYDSTTRSASCTELTYKYARSLRPDDWPLLAEQTLFRLASTDDTLRANALRELDRALDSLRKAGNHTDARRTLALFADGMWSRAQRELERPLEIELDAFEERAHHLERHTRGLVQLPQPPSPSSTLGVSEAIWSAQLHDRLAEWSTSVGDRSKYHRLALAPYVVLNDWKAVDSAARAMLERSPRDSALMPARALAAYRLITRPVREQSAVMAMFDSALAAMPRGDSARYDSFDDVLSKADDEWRYGFLPTERIQLDARGWVVLDPLWSTPVNELRLERRARVAEADYRYADIALVGQSGSETAPGRTLMRRGVPQARWSVLRPNGGSRDIVRAWPGIVHTMMLDYSPSYWQMFHHPSRFSINRLSQSTVVNTKGLCAGDIQLNSAITIVHCAEERRSEFGGVPFYGQTDTIDVTSALFRTVSGVQSRDSVDLYLGAHVPLRSFKFREANEATSQDRITLSAWLATPQGKIIYTSPDVRRIPSYTERAWTAQWTTRAKSGAMMHRIEAIEPTKPRGARGVALRTAAELVEFQMRGFGMSDLLVAASAKPRTTTVRRWSDLTYTPNGAVIAPRANFDLAWEVYDLQPAADGRVRWSVEIRREQGTSATRDDMRDVLVNSSTAGARVLANEADAPAVAYTRDEAAAAAVVDHLSFNLGDQPPGRHVVQVKIRDLVSGRVATRGVSVRILPPGAQRRLPPTPGASRP